MKGIITENNRDLIGRLENGKFGSALMYLDGESDETKGIIIALSNMFGNSGFICDGDFGTLLNSVIIYLTGQDE